jgi:hypothetical protein
MDNQEIKPACVGNAITNMLMEQAARRQDDAAGDDAAGLSDFALGVSGHVTEPDDVSLVDQGDQVRNMSAAAYLGTLPDNGQLLDMRLHAIIERLGETVCYGDMIGQDLVRDVMALCDAVRGDEGAALEPEDMENLAAFLERVTGEYAEHCARAIRTEEKLDRLLAILEAKPVDQVDQAPVVDQVGA